MLQLLRHRMTASTLLDINGAATGMRPTSEPPAQHAQWTYSTSGYSGWRPSSEAGAPFRYTSKKVLT